MFRLIDMATGEICDQGGNEAAGYKAGAGMRCPGARCEVPRLQLQAVAESLATEGEVKPVAARRAALHLQSGKRCEDGEGPPLKATKGEYRF